MLRRERSGHSDIEFGVCTQIGFEFVQRRSGADVGGRRRFSVQSALSAAGWLAQAVGLLDDAEQFRSAEEHQLVEDDGRSGGNAVVLERDARRHQR